MLKIIRIKDPIGLHKVDIINLDDCDLLDDEKDLLIIEGYYYKVISIKDKFNNSENIMIEYRIYWDN